MRSHYLDHLFSPRSIVVFGASERPDSVGGRVFSNLLQSEFAGPLYPVNPKHKRVFQRDCYPNLDAIGKQVDLAIIATPAASVPGIVPVSYTHLTLPTRCHRCRSRWWACG